METKVLDTATELAKNGTADLVLTALITVSIAVTVIGAIYILNKYFHINKVSAPLTKKIEEQSKMITNLCTGIDATHENNNELRHEVKEVNREVKELKTSFAETMKEHTAVLTKLSTGFDILINKMLK